VAALKRLLREVFAELTEHGGRLHALETASMSAAAGGWATGADWDPSAAAEITFMGAVEAAPALLLSRVRLHQTYSLPPRDGAVGVLLCHGRLLRLGWAVQGWEWRPRTAAAAGSSRTRDRTTELAPAGRRERQRLYFGRRRVVLDHIQGGSAAALHAACSTPDSGAGAGGPLLRGQLRSPVRDGVDELTAEVLLPAAGDAQPALHKVHG